MTIRTAETASPFTTREPLSPTVRDCCNLFDAVLRAPPRPAPPSEPAPAEAAQPAHEPAEEATASPQSDQNAPPDSELYAHHSSPPAEPENASSTGETAEPTAELNPPEEQPSEQPAESSTPSAEETALAAAVSVTAPPTPLPQANSTSEEPSAETKSNATNSLNDALPVGRAETPLTPDDSAPQAAEQPEAGYSPILDSPGAGSTTTLAATTESSPQIAAANSETAEQPASPDVSGQPALSSEQIVASESASPPETLPQAVDDASDRRSKPSSEPALPAKPDRAKADALEPLTAAPPAQPVQRTTDQQADAHNRDEATIPADRAPRKRNQAVASLAPGEPTSPRVEFLGSPAIDAATTESTVQAPTFDSAAAGTKGGAALELAATTTAPVGTAAVTPLLSQPSNNYPKAAAQLLTGLRRTSETRQQDVDQVRLLQRVARALESARDRGGEVRIRLNPPELGLLKVELQVQDGRLHARLEAETPAAQVVLLENVGSLRERLAEQGLRLERFDVDLSHRDSSGAGGQSGQPRDEAPRELFRPRSPISTPNRSATAESLAVEAAGANRPTDDRQVNVVV